jgi:hypothetical protein
MRIRSARMPLSGRSLDANAHPSYGICQDWCNADGSIVGDEAVAWAMGVLRQPSVQISHSMSRD